VPYKQISRPNVIARSATAPIKKTPDQKNYQWAIFTQDEKTVGKIVDELKKLLKPGQEEVSESKPREIYYDGKPYSVYIVSYEIAIMLSKQRSTESFKFVGFRKVAKTSPWAIWKEGLQTSRELIDKDYQHLFRYYGGPKY
jgi:hypothetical protein